MPEVRLGGLSSDWLPFGTVVACLLQIHFVLLISRQGKVRLAKWYSPYTQKERTKVSLTNAPALHRTSVLSEAAPCSHRSKFGLGNLQSELPSCRCSLSHPSSRIAPCSKPESLSLQITRELCGTILTRPAKLCNFIDWRGQCVAYKRWVGGRSQGH